MEMEIELSFDAYGRTKTTADTRPANNGPVPSLDYRTKTVMSDAVHTENPVLDKTDRRQPIDDLLFDCEITDCGLMPRTFWFPADGTKVCGSHRSCVMGPAGLNTCT